VETDAVVPVAHFSDDSGIIAKTSPFTRFRKGDPMKRSIVFLPLMLIVALTVACSRLTDFVPGVNGITPSDTIITEERDVSGFTGIDMRRPLGRWSLPRATTKR
jgi:hypothetical protein